MTHVTEKERMENGQMDRRTDRRTDGVITTCHSSDVYKQTMEPSRSESYFILTKFTYILYMYIDAWENSQNTISNVVYLERVSRGSGMTLPVHFVPCVIHRVICRHMVRPPGTAPTTFAPQDFPETFSEIGITKGVAEWIYCRVDITQPVTWNETKIKLSPCRINRPVVVWICSECSFSALRFDSPQFRPNPTAQLDRLA